ncbi:MAG: D-alanyl-D-alanine carboxypeptidase family protein [Gammaproteobacteria bacterium]|nr:D-alanyl-D-alanine carboxypeptidase family protein [Gammaproteobacteria bacterium]MDX2486144.1 D-alanyl-D-alanine carboxypeptidase family protein [Gammaproteobacteria bacterium]
MKKHPAIMGLLVLMFSISSFALDQQKIASTNVVAPVIEGKSWLLIDHDSGAVLSAGDPDLQIEPASLTKLMTAYIVFRELAEGRQSLDDMVFISEKAWRMEGSRMFIKVNTNVKLEDLVKGMIIQSGNDATVALAEHVAGTEESFVGLMNKVAAELGMTRTYFVNSSGMPGEGHLTTARDLATLTRELINHYPQYYKYYSVKDFTWNEIKQGNRNILLYRDPSVDGVKTGHTESAGYCLIGSAHREGMRLIAVVTGTGSKQARADMVQNLLNYGFRNYITQAIYPAGKLIQNVDVYKAASNSVAVESVDKISLTVPRRGGAELTQTVTIPDYVIAPIASGQVLGNIEFSVQGSSLGKYPLTAVTDVPEGGIIDQLIGTVMLWVADF